MAYIGRAPLNGFYTKQIIANDGSTTTFALTHGIASTTAIIVSVNAVILQPDVGYTLSGGGTNIIFASAPNATTYIHYLGESIQQSITDMNGVEFILDANADTSLTADTDDEIDIKVGGTDRSTIKATGFHNLDSIKFVAGTSDDMQIYHDGSNSYITNAVGALKIATETSGIAITIGHSTSEITIADNMTVAGDLTVTGTTSFADTNITNVGSIALDSITNDGTDITLDSSNDIVIDAAGGNIEFKDAGTLQLTLDMDTTSGVQILKLGVDTDDLVFQQYDGNEVVRIADDRRLYFYDKGGEYIYGDGTDLHITSGADINIPADIGLTFGNDGEKIEGDGTDLTITGNTINLTAVADVNIPSGVGITFATTEKIESDGTDLSITVGSNGDINVPANIGVTFGDDGEKIEGDGTDLTITGNTINLTATTDVALAVNTGLLLAGTEKIESDGTDLSITVGAGGDINIGTDIGLTFGNDGEKIEGDGTDLTITGNNIKLTATADVIIPADVGITFGTGEKIEGNSTDLTVTSGADINLTATADVNIPSGVGVTFGDDGEKIEGDGTDLTIAGNNINLTAVADVNIPSGVGLTFATGEKLESDGTDLSITVGSNGDINVPANIGLTLGDDGEKIEGDGTDLTILSSGVIKLAAGGTTNQITLADGALSPVLDNDIDLGTVSLQYKNAYVNGTMFADALGFGTVVMTLPTADGSADQILTTNGSGTLAFVDNSGGTDWQAVKTGNFTAAAGQGVFCNTTSSAFTITLPAGSIGDEVSIIDYAGTFDTNNCTVAANGSEKIHGSTDDLTVATERAAFTLVFTDSTQGWLLKDK